MKLKRPPCLLYFKLTIPYISIYTQSMSFAYGEMCYYYLAFHIRIFKWKFEIIYGLDESVRKTLKAQKENKNE